MAVFDAAKNRDWLAVFPGNFAVKECLPARSKRSMRRCVAISGKRERCKDEILNFGDPRGMLAVLVSLRPKQPATQGTLRWRRGPSFLLGRLLPPFGR